MSNYITKNPKKFEEFNSLKLFMENYKNSLNKNNKKITESYTISSNYKFLEISLENNIYLTLLLEEFIKSISKIGYKPTCDILKSTTLLNANNSGSSFSPLGIAGKATTLLAKTIPTLSQHLLKSKLSNITSKSEVIRNISKIVKARSTAMCDRILFALNTISYKEESFTVLASPITKYNHLPIYCIFDTTTKSQVGPNNLQVVSNNPQESKNNPIIQGIHVNSNEEVVNTRL